MANLPVKDAAGADKYLKAAGAGSNADPFVVEHSIAGVATDVTVQAVRDRLPAGGAASETTVAAISSGLGSDGASAPAITGTGVRGWLRAVYETLLARLPASVGGRLPVDVTFPSGQTVSGTVASGATDSGNPVKIAGVYRATMPTFSDGQRGDFQLSSRGEVIIGAVDFVSAASTITSADSASSVAVGEDGQSIITGTPSNNSAVAVAGSGNSSFSVLVTGNFTGTLQFERSLDNGTTWTPVAAFSAGTAKNEVTFSAPGAFHGNASAATNIRVRATAWTSGNAQVRILLGQGTGTVTVGNPIRLYDQTNNTQATIKPASTAPVAADPALVVGFSPNGNLVGLDADARQGALSSGTYTLSATPGTVLSVSIPDSARGFVAEASAAARFAISEDPAAEGVAALTTGGRLKASTETTRILAVGTGRTLRLRSTAVSPTVYVEFF